jgi:hypothetical protein
MAERVRSIETVAEQWQRALQRAMSEGLDVLVCGATGEAFVESATTPGTLYSVSRGHCTCPAGTFGAVCKHRAVFLAQIGELALPETQDDCPDCCGCGRQHFRSFDEPCETCGGSGIKPDHRLTGQPSVEIAANAA